MYRIMYDKYDVCRSIRLLSQGIHDAVDQATKSTAVATKHVVTTESKKEQVVHDRAETLQDRTSANALFDEIGSATLTGSEFSTRGKRHRGKKKKSSTEVESQSSSSTTRASLSGEKGGSSAKMVARPEEQIDKETVNNSGQSPAADENDNVERVEGYASPKSDEQETAKELDGTEEIMGPDLDQFNATETQPKETEEQFRSLPVSR